MRALGLTFTVVLLLPALARAGEGPSADLTPAKRKELEQKALELNQQGVQTYARGNLARATDLCRQALEINRTLYPKKDFPNGHPHLASCLNNVAFLYQAGRDYPRAAALRREALAICRAQYPKKDFPGGHREIAAGISRLASLHRLMKEHAKAEPLYREALEMYRLLYPKEQFPTGQLEVAGAIDDLALTYRETGAYDKAAVLLREALAVRRALYPKEEYPSGHPEIARTLSNLAFVCESWDYRTAERCYGEAIAMCRALYPRQDHPGGHPHLVNCVRNLAFLYQAAGEHAKAEPLYREALAMCRALYPRQRYPRGHPDLLESVSHLASLYRDTGEHGKAVALGREALAMCRALYARDFPDGHPDLAKGIDNLAVLHKDVGEYREAALLYRESLQMHRALYPTEKHPQGHPDLALSINNLAALHKAAGEYVKAEALFREALAMWRALYPKATHPRGHRFLAAGLTNLAAVLAGAGAHGRAGPLFREALEMYRALYPHSDYPLGHPELAQGLTNLAAWHQAAGEHRQAEALFGEALAMSRQLLLRYCDLAAEAESLNYLAAQPLARDGLLSASRHLPGRSSVYTVLWDSRAAVTRLQERRHRDLSASSDGATAALADRLRVTRRKLARLLLHPGRAGGQHHAAVDQLTREKEDLEKRIASRLKLAAVPPATTPTRLPELVAVLPPTAAFVDVIRYVNFKQDAQAPGKKGARQADCYVAFVVRKDRGVVRIELNEAAPIDAAWASWHKAILAGLADGRDERAAAARLAALAWQPLRDALGAGVKTVYLAADGRLAQVPWGALPGTRPDTVVLDEQVVCLVPHGPWLLERLQAKPARGGGDTLVAYGGIDYQGAPAAVAKSRGPRELELVGAGALPAGAERRLHWAALPGTAREQERVVALARTALRDPPVVRSGRAAGTDQLLEDLPRARYAHLATHGFFADPRFRSYLQVDPKLYEQVGPGERRSAGARSPLVLSGLVLAGADRRGEGAAPDRGIVTAEGLIGLRLENLDLAVLSACETGLGEVAGGEGVFGLQRAFHIAGAKNVIASLWQVDDEATAALMALLYHRLWVEKEAPVAALRAAQLALYHHPERIPALARARGPDFEKAARLPAPRQGAGRAPARLWAGFVLSGLGR
jgi:CHAT domain-containing protein